MGLDIIGVSHVQRVGSLCDNGCLHDYRVVDMARLTADRFWTRNFAGLEEGCYVETVRSHRTNFRAGSYISYNNWRDELSRMANNAPAEVVWYEPDRYKGQPFYELIDYADCEGTIGPVICEKLFNDFVKHRELAKATGDLGFYDLYCRWQHAFELGSRHGLVKLT